LSSCKGCKHPLIRRLRQTHEPDKKSDLAEVSRNAKTEHTHGSFFVSFAPLFYITWQLAIVNPVIASLI
jgi:hypothetical protein